VALEIIPKIGKKFQDYASQKRKICCTLQNMQLTVIYLVNVSGLAYAFGQLFFHFSRAPLCFRPRYHSRNGKAIMFSATPSRKISTSIRSALAIAIGTHANEIEKPISLLKCIPGEPMRSAFLVGIDEIYSP